MRKFTGNALESSEPAARSLVPTSVERVFSREAKQSVKASYLSPYRVVATETDGYINCDTLVHSEACVLARTSEMTVSFSQLLTDTNESGAVCRFLTTESTYIAFAATRHAAQAYVVVGIL